jgi:general secretion pathway protein J
MAADAGFTLLEAIVALAIGGFIVATLATVTSQWLGSWNRGARTLQQAELLTAALDRIVADLSVAQFVPASEVGKSVLFAGSDTSVVFARRPLLVEPAQGLELVRLTQQGEGAAATLIRSRAPLSFALTVARFDDRAPVVLLRAPYRAVFAYAGEDRVWRSSWSKATRLPRSIRITIIDGATGRALTSSTTVTVHVDVPMLCVPARSLDECSAAIDGAPVPGSPPGGKSPAGAAQPAAAPPQGRTL